MLDFSKLSTEELKALRDRDFSKVSTETLQLVRNDSEASAQLFGTAPAAPQEEQTLAQSIFEPVTTALTNASTAIIGEGNRDRINALLPSLIGNITGDDKTFEQRVLENQAEREGRIDRNPVSAGVGTAGGIGLSALAALGSGGGTAALQGANLLSRVAANPIARNAVFAGASGLLRDPNDFSEERVPFLDLGARGAAGATSATLGGLLGAGGGALSKASGKGAEFARRTLGGTKKQLEAAGKKFKGGLDELGEFVQGEGLLKGSLLGGRKRIQRNINEFASKSKDELDGFLRQADPNQTKTFNLKGTVDRFIESNELKKLGKPGDLSKIKKKARKLAENLLDEEGGRISVTRANGLRSELDTAAFGRRQSQLNVSETLDADIFKSFADKLRNSVDTRVDGVIDSVRKSGGKVKQFKAAKEKASKALTSKSLVDGSVASDSARDIFSVRNLVALGVGGGGANSENDFLRGLGILGGGAAFLSNNTRGQALLTPLLNNILSRNAGRALTNTGAATTLTNSLLGE